MRPILTLLILASLLATTSHASECEPRTSRPDLTIAIDDSTAVYVFDELCPLAIDCIGSFWIYAESNGIPGAQRNDDVRDDTCGGRIPSDTIVL